MYLSLNLTHPLVSVTSLLLLIMFWGLGGGRGDINAFPMHIAIVVAKDAYGKT